MLAARVVKDFLLPIFKHQQVLQKKALKITHPDKKARSISPSKPDLKYSSIQNVHFNDDLIEALTLNDGRRTNLDTTKKLENEEAIGDHSHNDEKHEKGSLTAVFGATSTVRDEFKLSTQLYNDLSKFLFIILYRFAKYRN